MLGAWIGAAAFNASLAAFLFGFGAGAIVQVIVQLAPTLRDGRGRTLHPPAVAGLLAGMALMFADRPAGEHLMAALDDARPSEAIEDYAKAIYALAAPRRRHRVDHRAGRPPRGHARVGVGDGQEARRARLVEHVPYHGVRLTADGERLALEVLRHHRLLELYLAEQLGVPWDRVHEEAEALEHVLSEDLEARIAAKLGNPDARPARRSDPRPRPEHRGGRAR